MTRFHFPVRKSLAAALASALITLSPGFGCYEALAAMSAAASAGKTVSVVPAGAGIAGARALGLGTNRAALGSVSLGGSLRTPAVAPSLRATALPASAATAVRGAAVSAAVAASPAGGTVQGVSGGLSSARAPGSRPALAAGRNSAEFSGVSLSPRGGEGRGEGGLRRLLAKPELVSAPAGRIAGMGAGEAKAAGRAWMDTILGARSSGGESLPVSARPSALGAASRGLRAPALGHEDEARPEAVDGYRGGAQHVPARSAGGRILGFLAALGKMAVGAGAAYGLHAGAVLLFPSVFGTVPLVALWAVSSSVLLLPIALHARYRLGLRDSARLAKPKHLMDLALGALFGALAVALPAFFGGAFLDQLMAGLPFMVVAGGVSAAAATMGAASKRTGGAGGVIDGALSWLALSFGGFLLGLVAPFTGVVEALPLTLGGFIGLAAIPALATLSFFLGRVIRAAESGRAFGIPGSLQAIRFPSYTWVMTGVVFALMTGYAPVWTNYAFAAWMFAGNMRMSTVLRLILGRERLARLLKYRAVRWIAGLRVFDFLFGSFALWAASTAFAAPITFLVLAFAPERAAIWTEDLLARFLPAGQPAPSTGKAPVELAEDKPAKYPRFFYWLKTGLAIGLLAASGALLAQTVFGWSSLWVNLGISAIFSVLPLVFSKWLIKKAMRAEPLTREQAPEVFAIMDDLLARINAERKAQGKKELPMPEIVRVPMPVPNAFATGLSPSRAMVGVTDEMLAMTLYPEVTRAFLLTLFRAADRGSANYEVFKLAVRGTLTELPADASPQTVIQALQDAPDAKIKAIGYRALRGVLGHEFSHVMHRDMLLGALAGTINSAIQFAAYGVLWAVGHAEAALRGLWAKLKGVFRPDARARERGAQARPLSFMGGVEAPSGPEAYARARTEGFAPQVADPATAAAAAQTVLSMVKIFAALWAPVMARVLAMASSRTREGHADESGGALTKDHESLALGLGLLTAWRPPEGFVLSRLMLPGFAAHAGIMTVNPLEQLYGAGLLDDADAEGVPVGRADDWFFELFITHPNTDMRIERLYQMARARQAGNAPGGPVFGR